MTEERILASMLTDNQVLVEDYCVTECQYRHMIYGDLGLKLLVFFNYFVLDMSRHNSSDSSFS
jgi:hypothetical protein